MKTITGFNISFDFGKLIKITDLIYYDGPLLSHYVSEKGDNYLFYWVDSDNEYNRWIVIRCNILSIQKYLDKAATLYSIITQPNDGFVYMVDIDNQVTYHHTKLIQIKNLPEDYKPAEDSYYTFEPQDDIDLLALSQKYSSGILELHIKGKDVRYGSMPLQKFAPIIPQVENIRKALSNKYMKLIKEKKKDADQNVKQQIEQELRLDTQYEFLCSMVGSIRIILKPINTQTSFSTSFSDDFAKEMINLFKSGYKKDDIKQISDSYDKNVLKKYNDFIYYLNTEELSMGIQWCNANSSTSYKHEIEYTDTKKILTNLSDIEFDKSDELKIRGRFYSLNIKTGNYCFESTEGDDLKSFGLLDETRKKIALLISFNKVYDVTIERKTTQQIAEKIKNNDTLISFIEVSEEN
jgi:hypothetical protein